MRTFLMFIAALILSTTAFSIGKLAPTTNPAKTGTGSITGSAVKDGQPLAGITVRLMQPAAPTTSDGTAPATQPSDGKHARRNARAGGRPTFVAQTNTDDKGNFTFSNLAAGNYLVVIRERESNIGGVSRATVGDNQTATVSITAKERTGGQHQKNK